MLAGQASLAAGCGGHIGAGGGLLESRSHDGSRQGGKLQEGRQKGRQEQGQGLLKRP